VIWEDKLEIITSQGPLFMAAAVSVALGLTLLVVSAVLRLSALKRLVRPGIKRATGQGNGTSRTAAGSVRATDIGYEAAGAHLAVPATPAIDPRRLADLHTRLRVAADRLESLQKADRENFTSVEISNLKGMGPAVEYLKKTEAV